MKKILIGCALCAACIITAGGISPAGAGDGAGVFQQYCAVCHPNGGNIINPNRTLGRADLKKYGINGPADIVKLMRNPGPAMRVFPRSDVSDADAKAVAKYVWKEFSGK